MTLHVHIQSAADKLGNEIIDRTLPEFAMRHRGNDGIALGQLVPADQSHAVFVHCFRRIGDWIVHVDAGSVGSQFLDHVDHARIADVGTVFLERQSEHADIRTLDRESGLDELLDRLLGDELAHAVVDAAAGQDDLRVVSQLVGLVRQVIRVHADAVPADQPGSKRQEIPLRSCGFEHFGRVQVHLVEQQRKLVHERDVEVALRVLDHLGGLRDLDRRRAVDASVDDCAVCVRDA